MKNEDDVIGNEITGGGSSSSGPLKSLLEVCPICGKEFSCNKTLSCLYGPGRTPAAVLLQLSLL